MQENGLFWVLYNDLSYFYKLSASQGLPKPNFYAKSNFFFGLAARPT